jgi:hypothetical protein
VSNLPPERWTWVDCPECGCEFPKRQKAHIRCSKNCNTRAWRRRQQGRDRMAGGRVVLEQPGVVVIDDRGPV